jgi:hypothetical protein
MRQTRMNTAPEYYSDFFVVARCRTGLRIRNHEVVGSIPTSSPNCQSLTALPKISSVPFCPKKSSVGGVCTITKRALKDGRSQKANRVGCMIGAVYEAKKGDS